MTVTSKQVHDLLNPSSIAIVGASERSAWSSAFIKNLDAFGYGERIYMVNSRADRVFGRPAYDNVSAVDAPLDHALIAVPAAATLEVLADCVTAGVRSVTAIASGFSEAGPSGQALAAQVASFCDLNDVALIGPNCYGFVNFDSGAVVSRNWLEAEPVGGAISMTFQSGQLNLSAYGLGLGAGIDFRYLISSGNELVVDTNDYFEYFIDDPGTRVLGGAIERVPDPARFESLALRAAEAGKPIVLCKLGRSEVGQRVAAAHTASVAGVDVVVDTFLRDLGVVVVPSLEELVQTAGVLAHVGPARGRRTVFLGGSGGSGGYFADQVDRRGVELVELSGDLRNQLAADTGLTVDSIGNPFDLTASGFDQLPKVVDTLRKSGEVDVIVAQGEQPRSADVQGQAHLDYVDGHMAALKAANEAGAWACFVTTAAREPSATGREMARARGVHYLLGEPGAHSLRHVVEYAANAAEAVARGTYRRSALAAPSVPDLLARGHSLSESESMAVLEAAGIPVPRQAVAQSADEATKLAVDTGDTVVLKIASRDILHKSDIGGVAVGVPIDQVGAVFDDIIASARKAQPNANIDGVLVAEHVPAGVELLLGVVVDPSIGPIVVVGAGGILVEIAGDVATAVPPFSPDRALDMLRTLKIWPVLQGIRGSSAADIDATALTISKFSHLVAGLADRVRTVEINPLVALPEGLGVRALDAVIELNDQGSAQ